MIFWEKFTYDGTDYDLSHLHPYKIEVVQPSRDGKPESSYSVQVIFGLHTFTRSINKGENPSEDLKYSDSREVRLFDLERHRLSFHLRGIVGALSSNKKCFHTGKGNFFVVNLLDEGDRTVEYEVYFEVSKSSERGVLNLFIQSAYVRDESHRTGRPKKKPIGFQIILYNIQNNKLIRAPE